MLTDEQKEKRKGKLTASRVAVLMTGDAEGILRLWQELRGEAEPEDLSHIWPVRLGEATEALQLDWFEEKNQMPVTRRGEVAEHPGIEWAACTLDGWVEGNACPIEVKHVGGREPFEVVVGRYQPQMQWQMFVCGAKEVCLSVIMGASEPIIEYVERNDEYIDTKLLPRAKQFMHFVEIGEPPVVLDPVPPPVEANKLYDMTGNESWQRHAQQWLQVKGAAETAKEAEKILKSLVPEDAKKCVGHGIYISRDRAGRLSLREGNTS